MSQKQHGAATPRRDADEPLGDRGHGDKTWSPDDEQGISNHVGEEENSGDEEFEEGEEGDDEEFESDDPSAR